MFFLHETRGLAAVLNRSYVCFRAESYWEIEDRRVSVQFRWGLRILRRAVLGRICSPVLGGIDSDAVVVVVKIRAQNE